MSQIAMYLGYVGLGFVGLLFFIYLFAYYQASKLFENGLYWKIRDLLKKASEK